MPERVRVAPDLYSGDSVAVDGERDDGVDAGAPVRFRFMGTSTDLWGALAVSDAAAELAAPRSSPWVVGSSPTSPRGARSPPCRATCRPQYHQPARYRIRRGSRRPASATGTLVAAYALVVISHPCPIGPATARRSQRASRASRSAARFDGDPSTAPLGRRRPSWLFSATVDPSERRSPPEHAASVTASGDRPCGTPPSPGGVGRVEGSRRVALPVAVVIVAEIGAHAGPQAAGSHGSCTAPRDRSCR